MSRIRIISDLYNAAKVPNLLMASISHSENIVLGICFSVPDKIR